MPQPPNPASQLYENLFSGRENEVSFEILSSGLNAICTNVELLLEDANLLISERRFARGQFILATADEEMAKVYILLDMCRLNFDSHESTIRRLCKAFYSHAEKHAYNEVYRGRIRSLEEARSIFHIGLQRWWPGDSESGEPDLPHDTVFNRDFNLYVDYIEFDQDWWVPPRDNNRLLFEPLTGIGDRTPLTESENAFDKIRTSKSLGLFNSNILERLNSCFSGNYINESTADSFFEEAHDTLYGRVHAINEITESNFTNSILKGWPLYHFLQ